MKKTILSGAALLFVFATLGCQPADTATDVSTDVTAPAAEDANVTATAETPAVVETPVAEEAPAAAEEAPVAEEAPAPAEEAPAPPAAE